MTLIPLILSLAISQGLTTNAPGVTGGGKVLWQAAFSTPGCYASGQTAGASSAIAITRATSATVALTSDASDLTTCASGEFRVGYDGLLVEPARTNVVLASNTISAANAFNVNWVAWPDETVVDVTTSAVAAPGGGTWHTITNEAGGTSNVGQAYQTVTTASSTTFVASAWMKKPTGEDTTHAGIHVGCGAGTPSACTCVRSDGGSCTASTVATNYCQALVADLSTTPVRVSAKVTCSGAITSSIVALVPGNYGSSIGITDFSGVQHEVGTYPTSLVVTTTTALPRNMDLVSATVPAVPSKWCVATTAKPYEGRAWSAENACVLSMGPASAVNSMRLCPKNGTQTEFAVYGGASGYKGVYPVRTPAAGEHRWIGCNNAGALQMWEDGVSLGIGSGAGTGIFTTAPTTLLMGHLSTPASLLGGFLKNVKVCAAKNAKECK